jgi:hypothetical protein
MSRRTGKRYKSKTGASDLTEYDAGESDSCGDGPYDDMRRHQSDPGRRNDNDVRKLKCDETVRCHSDVGENTTLHVGDYDNFGRNNVVFASLACDGTGL